jgi:hypothetical protein
MFSAALALRASRQVIGNPTSVSACHSQVVSGPVSSPMRTACGACLRITASIASGVLAQRPRQTRWPCSSRTCTLVSFNETSNPTY